MNSKRSIIWHVVNMTLPVSCETLLQEINKMSKQHVFKLVLHSWHSRFVGGKTLDAYTTVWLQMQLASIAMAATCGSTTGSTANFCWLDENSGCTQ